MNYIVFDLEATCWEVKELGKVQETIEIGAIKVNSNYSVISEFNCFVKPIIEPSLSEFCINLTSIKQIDIDSADTFDAAICNFKNWININEPYLLCSWGYYDRKQLTFDCHLHNLGDEWINNHISLKHQYARMKNLKRPVGMSKALELENLTLEGTHHRGIDDAKNITQIFLKFKSNWKDETTPNT